jgi:hypothetical protein
MSKPVLALLGGLLLGGTAHAVDVTACGQTIHPREIGVLQNDLTCSSGGVGVRLENGAVLDLGGHSITLGLSTAIAVECLARCSVLGPGTLTTSSSGHGGGIVSAAKGRVVVTGVQLSGFVIPIQAPFARVTLTDSTIQDGTLGVDARRIDVEDVTIATEAIGTCITGFTGRVRGTNLALSGCNTGIQVGKAVDLSGLTWTGGSIGVITEKRVKLVDSSVTGASVADVVSARLPRLVDTACDRSARVDSDGIIDTTLAWGVCALD